MMAETKGRKMGQPKRPTRPAAGVVKGATKRIVVSFDPETFDQIAAKAHREGISFNEAVRQGVEWMLMDEAT